MKLVSEQGRPSTEAAKNLVSACIDTLRSRLKGSAGAGTGQADRQNREVRRLRKPEAEVRTLRKQVAEKDEVIDVLKKLFSLLPRSLAL